MFLSFPFLSFPFLFFPFLSFPFLFFPFLSFFVLSFPFLLCLFLPIDLNLLYSAVVSMGILCVPFPTVATCLCPVGEPVPFYCILFPSFVLFSYDVPFLSFPFLSFPSLSFPFLCFFPVLSFSSMPFLPIDVNLLYSAVVSMGILCVSFPTVATCLCPVGEPVPFYRILFTFLVLFSYDVPFL